MMTEHEICAMYRGAKDQRKQIPILADLCQTDKVTIIGILLKNGENVPDKEIQLLFKRLDTLEVKILDAEREYKRIAAALTGHSEI